VTEVASAQVDGGSAIPWKLIVVRSADDEAYALPSGRILISEVFIRNKLRSVEELAFVLAHEASHVILAHEADTLDIVQALLPHGVNQSVQGLYSEMDFDMGLLIQIAPLVQHMEEDADSAGLMLASLAGFNPDRASNYVKRMTFSPARQSILATHPAGERRLSLLRKALPQARRIYQRYGRLAASQYPVSPSVMSMRNPG